MISRRLLNDILAKSNARSVIEDYFICAVKPDLLRFFTDPSFIYFCPVNVHTQSISSFFYGEADANFMEFRVTCYPGHLKIVETIRDG